MIDILVTINANYIHTLTVMLKSLAVNSPDEMVTVYIMSRDLAQDQVLGIAEVLQEPRINFILCPVRGSFLAGAPTSRRYPISIYDRLFAAEYLPKSLDRILYLDPDLVVLRSLRQLWEMPLGDSLFAAASHLGKVGDLYNSIRVDVDADVPYFNSGVLLMNLAALRRRQDPQEIRDYILTHTDRLMLPDQDVLTALYGQDILPIDPFLYNMTERLLKRCRLDPDSQVNAQWVKDHSVIFHYVGRNKPWKKHYRGKLGGLYRKYEGMLQTG